MTTLQEIGVSALFNIGITSVFLLGFIVFSVQPINDRVYYPKLYIKGIRKRRPYGPPQLKHRGVYFNMDIYQYLRVFHWARSALRKTEEEIIKHAGLDSAVYLHIYLVGWASINFHFNGQEFFLHGSSPWQPPADPPPCYPPTTPSPILTLILNPVGWSSFTFIHSSVL